MTDRLPQRPHSHVVGDVGTTCAAFHIQKWGWTADHIRSDYGEDLDCTVFVDGSRTSLHFRCQVKSRSKDSEYVRELADGDFSVSVDVSTLRAWVFCNFPVFLLVYDETSDSIFWANATAELQSMLGRLSQDTASVRVRRGNTLKDSRAQIEQAVVDFNAQLLRIGSPVFDANVFAVQMPHYRAIPPVPALRISEMIKAKHSRLDVSSFGAPSDLLPAWTSTLRTLDPTRALWAVRVSSGASSVTEFGARLRAAFRDVDLEDELCEGEWLSFSVSPFRLAAGSGDSEQGRRWTSGPESWAAFSRIGDRVVSDEQYCFGVPESYRRSFPVRSFSWKRVYHVDPEGDIAFQLLGRIPCTPSDREQQEAVRQYAKKAYAIWSCEDNEVAVVEEVAYDQELTVTVVGRHEGRATCLIAERLFSPQLGMYPAFMSWKTFDELGVSDRLQRLRSNGTLPGAPAPSAVASELESSLVDTTESPKWYRIDVDGYIQGMPIDHSERAVVASRFAVIPGGVDDFFARLRERLSASALQHERGASVSVQHVDEALPLYSVDFEWTPRLTESTEESLTRLRRSIQEVLGAHDIGKIGKGWEACSVERVLRGVGDLMFE